MSNPSRADKKGNKPKLSIEAQEQVKGIIEKVVPVSFTKQQRKEVQKAIDHGMETIRSQAKSNNRDRDKKVKKLQAQLECQRVLAVDTTRLQKGKTPRNVVIPWTVLIFSWVGFAVYLYLS